MLSLILAATIANVPAVPPSHTAATGSAKATVRIVRGAEVRFNKLGRFEASVMRASSVRERDGSVRTANLVEFY